MNKGGKATLVVLGAVQGSILGLCASNDIDIEFINVGHWRSRIGLYNGTAKGKERDNLKDQVNSLSYQLEVKRDDLENLNKEEQEIDKKAIE